MEVLLVITLLSLIVMALMAVFSSTQRAFRASVTQSDVMEGGRMAVDLISSDLRGLTPSYGVSNGITAPMNFFVLANYNFESTYSPLVQNLPGSTFPRTNLLNYIFILGRENTKWTGVGYVVNSTNSSTLFPLYRFYAETNTAYSPRILMDQFYSLVANGQWTNLSHIVDGVVHLTVRAYDRDGRWIQDFNWPYSTNVLNTKFLAQAYGEAQLYMFSNTVPASVELELGLLEDHAQARAESLPNNVPAAPPNDRRTQYLQNQSGSLHIFRQRVSIPNVDPSAYQ